MTWTLSPATPADAPAIADLIHSVSPPALPAGEPEARARWLHAVASAEVTRSRMKEPGVTHLVVHDPERYVGGTAFVRLQGSRAYLGGLMCRVRHIDGGRRLLEACLQIARDNGCSSAYGHVYSGNKPVLLAARWLGFQEIGRYRDDPFFPGHEFVVLERIF